MDLVIPFTSNRTSKMESPSTTALQREANLMAGKKWNRSCSLRTKSPQRPCLKRPLTFPTGWTTWVTRETLKFQAIFSFFSTFHHMQANSTINFTIVSYGLRGNEIEMRPLTLGDLNLCNQFSSPVNLWQANVKFAENFFAKCNINLKELIERQPNVDTKFSSLYLNYYENQANFLQTIPILVRNAFEVNKVRFFALVRKLFIWFRCIASFESY